MALNQIDEEKKRKLRSASWLNRSNPMSTYNEEGKPITLNQTPHIVNVIDNLKNTAEYRKNINDPTKAFSAETVPTAPAGQPFSSQKPILQTMSSNESKTAKLYEPSINLTLPRINEIPNEQIDKELGKMNVSTDGDTTTYNIGRDTLSYKLSDQDKQLKTNLERINQMVASGASVSPEDMDRINNLRQQAGFLRGGTDKKLASNTNNGVQQVLLSSEFQN